jgi:hypothetical protein
MKRTVLVPLFATLLTLPALNSCSSDINEPVFDQIVTINEGEIPKYSEYGFNTAGARITRSDSGRTIYYAWKLDSYANVEIEKKDGGSLYFSMRGMTSTLQYADVAFSFSAEISDTLTGLRALVNQEFSVQKGNLIRVDFPDKENISDNNVRIKSASLHFTSCRSIYKNNLPEGVSLSGTFEFTGVGTNNVNVTVNNGRFDILFDAYNGSKYTNP